MELPPLIIVMSSHFLRSLPWAEQLSLSLVLLFLDDKPVKEPVKVHTSCDAMETYIYCIVQKKLEDISPFCGATDTPVLDKQKNNNNKSKAILQNFLKNVF